MFKATIDNIKELWKYRALVGALAARHLSVRYRGSALGFLWSLLNPLCLILIYTLVFRYYIRFNTVENYTLFLLSGLLPWIWSTSAITEGTASISGSGHLITKSMFPAQILPAVSAIATMVNFLLSLPLLVIAMVLSGMHLHVTLLLIPLVVLLQLPLLFGLSLMLGSLNVKYRDIQHLVGNIITFLFFLCPIVYPAESVPERFRFTLDLNPFALITTLYQKIVLGGPSPDPILFVYLFAFSVFSIVIGSVVFNRYRESFAELL